MSNKVGNKRRFLGPLGGGFGLVLALGAPFALGAAPVMPTGGSVVSGSASISTPSSTSTLINQSSQKALINWKDFSIGSGSNVTFQQPNSLSITLNRVTGPNASAINGGLSANGQVWIINGNGILFGQGARVDVGGLIATTSDMRDSDFDAGNYNFGIPGNPNASVVNQGSIKTGSGGSAVLSASRVVNGGVIQADLGKVVLGGASTFSVDFDGDNLIRYAITAPVPDAPKDADGKPAPDLVSNSGSIAAKGGKVLLTARAANNVVDNVINSTGIVEATSAKMENGEIVLDAGEGGAVNVAGTLDASGANAGESGGRIALLADTVTVAGGAKLNASGDAGGGSIAVGGDLHGAGPDANASAVTVGAASIAADATGNGNGGTIAVYSTGATKVSGSLSAKGGAAGGNGGAVETSGENLNVTAEAKVDTSAPKGVTGNWLLDPANIIVATGGTTALSGGVLGKDTDSGDTDTIAPSTITTALATTNVRLEATNDITVNNQVTYTSGNSLTFLAQNDLIFNASVQNAGTGAILAVGGWDGTTAAANILAQGAFGAGGGSVAVNGVGGGIVAVGSKGGATTVAGFDVSLSAGDAVAQIGYHGAGGGDILIAALNDVSLSGGNTQLDYAQLGNGHAFGNLPGGGDVTGNISVTAGGIISFTSHQGGGLVWLGNAAGQGFIESGDVNLNVADIDDENNAVRSFNAMIAADLGTSSTAGTGGNVTIGITNPDNENHPGTTNIGDSIVYNSPHDLAIMSAGSLTVGGMVENSGSGGILLVAGWDGVTGAADVPLTPGSYGNDFNEEATTLMIGGLNAGGDASVGSRLGSTELFTGNLLLDAVTGYAQAGYHGAGSGRIDVQATGDVTLSGGESSGAFAQIGNGGLGTSGDYSGYIFINAGGDISLHSGFASDAYAQIGHGGLSTDGNASGDISVTGNNISLTAEDAYAQIGHGAEDGNGDNDGFIYVNASGDLTLTGGSESAANAQIGHGGPDHNGNSSGDIDIHVAGTTFFDTQEEGGLAWIGNVAGEGGLASGDVTLTTGDIDDSEANGHSLGEIIFADLGSTSVPGSGGNVTIGFTNPAGGATGPEDPIVYDSPNTLTLMSAGDLFVGATVQNAGTGNIVGVAGWDGFTSAADVPFTPGSYGNAFNDEPTTLTIGGEFASGNVSVGSAGGTTSLYTNNLHVYADNGYAQIGYHGEGSGGITVQAIGDANVFAGHSSGFFAQIGNGGLGTSGDVSGGINVHAEGNVNLIGGSASDAYVQIGHGGQGENGSSASGLIDVFAENDVLLTGGSGNGAYAQIGHGGNGSASDNTGDIFVQSLDNNVEVTAGSGESADAAYAQIGHGGEGSTGSSSGSINVAAGDNVFVVADQAEQDSLAYAMIGHRGNGGDGLHGDISVEAGGDVELIAGMLGNSFVQIGHGGLGTDADTSGNIFVSGDNITLTAQELYAHIGNGAEDGNGDNSGTITVNAAGDLTLNGGTEPAADAQIGHGGQDHNGNSSGDINVTVGGLTFFGSQEEGGRAWIGHVAGESGTIAGNVTLKTGDIDSSESGPELSDMILADIGTSNSTGGNILIEFTNPGGPQGPKDNALVYNSPHALTVMSTGDLVFGAQVQNSGSGNVMAVAGWDGHTAPGSILATLSSYGNGGHGILIGGNIAAGDVQVGSAGGTTTIAGGSMSLTAINGRAQLGFHGTGGGDLTVRLKNNLTLAASNANAARYAQIGNGDARGNNGAIGDAGGHIDLRVTGAISLSGFSSGAGAVAQIGNVAGTGHKAAGNVTIVARGASDDGSDESIGNSILRDLGTGADTGGNVTVGFTDPNGENSLDSNIAINTPHDFTFFSAGDIAILGTIQNAGTGNMTLTAGWNGNLNAPTFGNNGGSVLIGGNEAGGNASFGTKGGTTLVAGSDVLLQAVHGSAQIGFNGAATGNIVVSATGDVTLASGGVSPLQNAALFTQIGHGGYLTQGSMTGAIQVSALGEVTLNGGTGSFAYSQIGNGGAETNVSANADFSETGSVSVIGSTVGLSAGSGQAAYVQIGDGGFEAGKNLGAATSTIGGHISVVSAGAVQLTGNGANAYGQIGNGGGSINGNASANAHGVTSGDIVVVAAPVQAGSVTMVAGSGAGAYVQIGNGGQSANTPTAAQPGNFTIGGNISVADLSIQGGNQGSNSYGQIGNGDASNQGTANVSGDIVIAALPGGTVTLDDGTASNSQAKIGNAIGNGTVTGTITGFKVPVSVLEDLSTKGTIAVLARATIDNTPLGQNGGPPAAQGPMSPVMMMAESMSMGTVESQEEPAPSDAVATSVGNSLSGAPGSVPSRTISLIGGLLRQFSPPPGASTPTGVPPADQDYSSWGNEALWQ